MSIVIRGFMLSLGVLLCASTSLAEAIHYDVFVTSTGTGSKLVIGGYDDASPKAYVTPGQFRVFGGTVVGTGTSLPFESELPGEPGFGALSQASLNNPSITTPANTYTALTGSTPLTFNFQPITIGASTRNLFFWDGAGAAAAFSPVGADVTLSLIKYGGGGWTESISGTNSGIEAGNTIASTGANGSIHGHLYAAIAASGAAPSQGFYLFSLQMQMTGYTASDPLFFVYGAVDPGNLAPQFAGDYANFELAHGIAETWVQDNLVAVPEPASLGLAGLGAAGLGAAALRSWRRRTGRKAARITV